jgi:hypothetical protein
MRERTLGWILVLLVVVAALGMISDSNAVLIGCEGCGEVWIPDPTGGSPIHDLVCLYDFGNAVFCEEDAWSCTEYLPGECQY